MAAILLSDFVWEGTNPERLIDPYVIANKRDGHIFKESDTGESYLHRNGDWEFINLGLSFIKATKSGRITTDGSGFYHVDFVTPFIDDLYTVALSCKEIPTKEIPLAVFDNLTVNGFDIYSYNIVKKTLEGNIVVSWLCTRDYNP
jgi:hypothetical protein